MYSKEQVSKLRQEFWTTFGKYISPHLSAEGLKVNWINYKTGIKDVYFRMRADKKTAYIGIEITHQDEGLRELFYEQFLELKLMLEMNMEEEWIWDTEAYDEVGGVISRIYIEIGDVNIFNKDTWPALISFFKPRIIALDAFWADGKYAFDALK